MAISDSLLIESQFENSFPQSKVINLNGFLGICVHQLLIDVSIYLALGLLDFNVIMTLDNLNYSTLMMFDIMLFIVE